MGFEDDGAEVDVDSEEEESDDMLENSPERPDIGDEEEEEEEEEEDDDEMIHNSLRRHHMGDNTGDMIDNLVRRHHVVDDDGDMLENLEERPNMSEDGDELIRNLVGRSHVGDDGEMVENSVGRELTSFGENQEPFAGMEFASEEAAKMFYNSYARRMGFSIRVSIYCKSKRDGSIISRRFVCSKEGFRRKRNVNNESRNKRPRAITREGCKAMIVVKKQNNGRWVLSKFIKDHSHQLEPPGKVHSLRSHRGDKDKTIRELTHELERVNRKCAGYRSHLLMVLKEIEEHLSKRVEDIRQSIREIESEEEEPPRLKQP
ncbi:protein FAR1-RELATED SEQUENCE 5 [Magnolia sinica]|uniref:protein FAR1-RELATED SEQUENCE 5 n=1 Tax=Magnolia sinica TaxID=86752 RepID=UPI0026593364|nr:protein FAR1-RELATED SEQUENCE 5 [Magnolia sinica]